MFSPESLSKLSKILKSISPDICLTLEKIKTPITCIELYKIFGLDDLPKISLYESEGILVEQNIFSEEYELSVNNNVWMTFNPKDFSQLFQLYSHYNLAKGHCICTGLGFGLREKWLSTKKEVSKITVLEKNIEVIKYHKEVNPDLVSKIEIINCDASEYKGKCDTLLLDHYEQQPYLDLSGYFQNIKKCCNNIEHDVLWIWPLEDVITSLLRPKNKNIFADRYKEYLFLRKKYPTLPDLTKSQLNSYCDMYYF